MTDTQLYSYRITEVTLSDAISQCKGYLQNAIALLYSPKACLFAQLDLEDNLINSMNKKIDLNYLTSYIFEARIFNQDYEIRWLNDNEGIGNAVLITQTEITESSDYLSKLNEQTSIIDVISQKYLLWGEKDKIKRNENVKNSSSDGWLRLSTARIGKVEIPFNDTLKDNERIYLNTVEYLAEIDEYGNVAVIEERLVNLTKHPSPSNST